MANDRLAKALNPANIISLSRVAAVPVLVILLLFDSRPTSVLAALVYLFATLTDLLDGYLARSRNLVTDLGRFLDPLADKLINAAALIMLIPLGRIPAWMVFLIIGRDIAITGLRAMASAEGIVISASRLGKGKTFLQDLAIFLLLAHYPIGIIDFHLLGLVVIWVALVVTYWSGIVYFMNFFKAERQVDNGKA